jgi:hypothetical protein
MRDKSSHYFPVIEKYYSSGLTKRIFCEQNSIKQCTLEYWKRRYKEKDKPAQAGSKGFASLTITESKSQATVTIQYTDGTRLILENLSDTSGIKQFIPVFNK